MLALVALALVTPVPGAVARGFEYAGDPFAAGHHRGIDLSAAPGATVRAACTGRVTFAGRAGAGAVAIRCGRFSVTHLPLRPSVRAGQRVVAGAPLGTVARSGAHDGLHLGVRRASDPLGYVDPAPLLREPPRQAPPAGPRTVARRTAPPPPHPAPLPSGPPGRSAPAPPRAVPAPAAPQGSSPVAPWPAWAGLALLLAGASGAGAARVRRGRRASLARAGAAAVR